MADPGADPTIFLGLGAQKAGSSWLYQTLRGHPECALSKVKELHYFDTVAFGKHDRNAKRIERVRASHAARRNTPDEAAFAETDARLDAWAAMLDHRTIDCEAYLAHLRGSLEDRPQAKVVGEVTPAYATLTEGTFATMAGMSTRTKAVFIMRDPIARLWSALRMRVRKIGGTPEDQLAAARETVARMTSERGLGQIMARGDYRHTLDMMTRHMPPDRRYALFYEDMVTRGAGDICRFLGIKEVTGDLSARVNTGTKLDLPRDLAVRMMQRLRRQYDYVAERFGTLPDAWRRSLELYGEAHA